MAEPKVPVEQKAPEKTDYQRTIQEYTMAKMTKPAAQGGLGMSYDRAKTIWEAAQAYAIAKYKHDANPDTATTAFRSPFGLSTNQIDKVSRLGLTDQVKAMGDALTGLVQLERSSRMPDRYFIPLTSQTGEADLQRGTGGSGPMYKVTLDRSLDALRAQQESEAKLHTVPKKRA